MAILEISKNREKINVHFEDKADYLCWLKVKEEILKNELLINWLEDFLKPKEKNGLYITTVDCKNCKLCNKWDFEKDYLKHFEIHLKEKKTELEIFQKCKSIFLILEEE